MVPPSLKFLMGTDNLGRDIFSRIMYGARISVTVGLFATLISVTISAFIGVTSGYIGGALDLILQRFVDAFMCLPGLVILMLLTSLFGAGLWQIIIILGVTGGIGGSRMLRGIVFQHEREHVPESCRRDWCINTNNIQEAYLSKHFSPNDYYF